MIDGNLLGAAAQDPSATIAQLNCAVAELTARAAVDAALTSAQLAEMQQRGIPDAVVRAMWTARMLAPQQPPANATPSGLYYGKDEYSMQCGPCTVKWTSTPQHGRAFYDDSDGTTWWGRFHTDGTIDVWLLGWSFRQIVTMRPPLEAQERAARSDGRLLCCEQKDA